MTPYNKLVRDKIPQILDAKGVPYEKRIADVVEYKKELVVKLQEEVDEFKVVGDIEELADVMEVIEALKNLPEYAEVEAKRIQKKAEKGGFEDWIILKGEK